MFDSIKLPNSNFREWFERVFSPSVAASKPGEYHFDVVDMREAFAAGRASQQSFDPRKMCSRCAGSDPGCRICKDLLASQQAYRDAGEKLDEILNLSWHDIYEMLPAGATTIGERQELAKALMERFR